MRTKEQRLAEALKKGDTSALAEIIDGYADCVCTVIRNFSREAFTEEDIGELCGGVFFGLWEHRGGNDAEFEKKDVTFTFEATGDTIDAHETGMIIKYELPEEIVISDMRDVTYTEKNVRAADDGRILLSYGGFWGENIGMLPGLPFSTCIKNSRLFNMTTVEIEYNLSAAYSTKITE